jgi:molybdate transport system permease protein
MAPEWTILMTSFAVASRALLCALPFAIAMAYLLSRPTTTRSAGFGRVILDGLTHLPVILPPVLVGFLLLILFGRNGPLGAPLEQWGVHLAFTTNGAALATAVMTFPLLVRSIRLAFEATDARLFEAAAMLRAGPLDRFFTIALPLAAPGIVAGAVTAFAAAMGEFGAVITFAANIPGQTQTLPLAIYAALQEPGGESEAWRLAAISFAVAFAGLVAAEFLRRRVAKRLSG